MSSSDAADANEQVLTSVAWASNTRVVLRMVPARLTRPDPVASCTDRGAAGRRLVVRSARLFAPERPRHRPKARPNPPSST